MTGEAGFSHFGEGGAFHFDHEHHEYSDEKGIIPHITGMLERAGLVDDTWFTEESSDRGTAVHTLTADYDLGAIEDPTSLSSVYKGYLLAHVAAMRAIAHDWNYIEVPLVHPLLRFGGRPDRIGTVLGLRAVLEIKSGARTKTHGIQTAMQAILAASVIPLPAPQWARFGLYLKPSGKFRLEQFSDLRDYDEARRIIRLCC